MPVSNRLVCAAGARTEDHALEVQLREANEEALLPEAVRHVLKKDSEVGHVARKAFGQVLPQKRLSGLSVSRACRCWGVSRQGDPAAGPAPRPP